MTMIDLYLLVNPAIHALAGIAIGYALGRRTRQ